LGRRQEKTKETMPDEDPEPGNEGIDAPPRLIEALRRLPQPVVLVPAHVDAAALSRPRLHLARVREMQGQGPESGEYRLALAARSAKAGAAPVGTPEARRETGFGRTPMEWWSLTWKARSFGSVGNGGDAGASSLR
jgi:hypothetical protein